MKPHKFENLVLSSQDGRKCFRSDQDKWTLHRTDMPKSYNSWAPSHGIWYPNHDQDVLCSVYTFRKAWTCTNYLFI